MTRRHDFAAIVADVEARLVRELGLAPLTLPPVLARLEGTWRDQWVVLAARAYTGPEIRYARFVEIRGDDVEIGNVLALAQPALTLPILGVDLVDLGRERAVVVADLSPIAGEPTELDRQLALVRDLRAGDGSLGIAGELPAWAVPWFSPAALLVKVAPERASAVSMAVDSFAAAFVELVVGARCQPAEHAHAAAQQAAYCAAHRDHDQSLAMLRTMFEPALADRFVREVLFPDWLASAEPERIAS